MPIIVKPPGSTGVTDWVNQEDSVMEHPLMQALKKLVKFTGVTDPDSQIQDFMSPTSMTVAPLVTLFKNKAARELATETFRNKANRMGGNVAAAAGQFADDYPRVAAHIKPMGGRDPAAFTGFLRNTAGDHAGQVPVTLPRNRDLDEIKNIMYHEGTHTAQALGNSKFDELYDEAERLLGYNDNPFEISAWDAGNRAGAFGKRTVTYTRPENAIKSLKGYAEDLGPASKLAKIFKSRSPK